MSNCEFKFLVRTEHEKDYSIQNHTHPCYELVYYLDGMGESVIDYELQIRAGHVHTRRI